jgi:uncharacterized glyoxalase superfamily protein PhnB
MKRRTGEPWMTAGDYAGGLRGFGVDLLVREIARATDFQRAVLGSEVLYEDLDFAALRHGGSQWMLHADHTFADHPLLALTGDGALRGVGVELRLYDCDPDAAEARARARGDHVLAPSADKPHGLRECCLVDPDGYVWVPSRRL